MSGKKVAKKPAAKKTGAKPKVAAKPTKKPAAKKSVAAKPGILSRIFGK